MSKIVRVSPELREFLAPPESQEVEGSAFGEHGIWAPGVILMRNLQFTAKALIICGVFLIPICALAWVYNKNTLESIAFSAKERLGVEYNREIFPVIQAAQKVRRDSRVLAVTGKEPESFSASKEYLSAAQAKLAAVEQKLGKQLDTAKAYAAVTDAFAQTSTNASSADALFASHSAHIAALIALISTVSDNSNLTLDPDLDSYFIMDAMMFRAPDIIENSGKLRGLGLAILKSGAITMEQQRALSELIPVAEHQSRNMIDGLAKSFAADPTLAARVQATPVLEATTSYFALARKLVIDQQDYSPEAQATLLAAANKTVNDQVELAQRLATELDRLLARRVADNTTMLIIINSLCGFAILLAAYLFYTFFLVTRGGLNLISGHLQEMAEGDLRRAPAKPWGRDEPAMVITDLRLAYDSLHALIRTVRHSARALYGTSGEIAAASLELSGRTESAAASLEEQSAAMEQIGSTVANTAERARAAAKFATENASVAEKGGQVIGTVVQTMQNIHASSSKINDIIGVINGIAFQTNILALNAAVEAARAGEAGRGFAVVASEVRSLAQRSADAAREIKELISNSVDQISSGTAVVEQAGNTMRTMVTNAQQINVYLSEISGASQEEAVGVAEVTRAIQELDQSTQSNAALVEETSKAAGSLTEQAEALQNEIANFKV
jgi:methyl-accepting chemotaxis protein